jgi:hypothetical protein
MKSFNLSLVQILQVISLDAKKNDPNEIIIVMMKMTALLFYIYDIQERLEKLYVNLILARVCNTFYSKKY